MKLSYTIVIAASILLGFSVLSYTISRNGRYMPGTAGMLLDTRTGDLWAGAKACGKAVTYRGNFRIPV